MFDLKKRLYILFVFLFISTIFIAFWEKVALKEEIFNLDRSRVLDIRKSVLFTQILKLHKYNTSIYEQLKQHTWILEHFNDPQFIDTDMEYIPNIDGLDEYSYVGFYKNGEFYKLISEFLDETEITFFKDYLKTKKINRSYFEIKCINNRCFFISSYPVLNLKGQKNILFAYNLTHLIQDNSNFTYSQLAILYTKNTDRYFYFPGAEHALVDQISTAIDQKLDKQQAIDEMIIYGHQKYLITELSTPYEIKQMISQDIKFISIEQMTEWSEQVDKVYIKGSLAIFVALLIIFILSSRFVIPHSEKINNLMNVIRNMSKINPRNEETINTSLNSLKKDEMFGLLANSIRNTIDDLHQERLQKEQTLKELKQSRDMSRWQLRAIPQGYLYIDSKEKVLEYNLNLMSMFEINHQLNDFSDFIEYILFKRLDKTNQDVFEEFHQKIISNPGESFSIELVTLNHNTYGITNTHYSDDKNNIIGTGFYFEDKTQEKAREVLIQKERFERLEAESLNKQKNTFLAYLSHDLKTPLNAIIVLSDFLHGSTSPEKKYQYIQTIKSSSKKLLSQIDDILMIASKNKLEDKLLQSGFKSFNPFEVVFNIVEMAKEAYKQNQNQIFFIAKSNTPISIISNEDMFFRIILNLVSNACKFTKNGKIFIDIEFDEIKHEIFIDVSDTGKGIDQDRQHLIFEPFTRAENNNVDGVGLGLAITQKFAQALSGNVWLENSETNKGSLFKIRMPIQMDNVELPLRDENKIFILKDSQLKQEYLLPENSHVSFLDDLDDTINSLTNKKEKMLLITDQKDMDYLDKHYPKFKILFDYNLLTIFCIINDEEIIHVKEYPMDIQLYMKMNSVDKVINKELIHHIYESTHNTYNDDSSSVNHKDVDSSIKMLSIEDNEANQLVIEAISNKYNISCDFVYDGQAALEILSKQNTYHVLLVDRKMPRVDGEEFIRQYKQSAFFNPHQKIYMITSDHFSLVEHLPDKLGFDGVLSKPVNESQLIGAIKKAEKYLSEGIINDKKKVINFETIAALENINSQLVARTYASFLKNSKPIMDDIKYSVTHNEITPVKALLHKLKGQSFQIGADILGEYCQYYEIEDINDQFLEELEYYYTEFINNFEEHYGPINHQ